ncbi:MAG TPA: phosphatase [Clostridia bacterium]|nr:phosphatase [Clostridia bacterium]
MKLLVDMHVHTIASGHAYSTILEIARAAREKGLEGVAITDHGPAMPGGPHGYHFSNMRRLPPVVEGVRIFRGVEANIMDTGGRLDMEPRYLKHLELILAGFHVDCFPPGRSVAENTRALVNAMASGWVDIIVHPGNPQFQIDAEAVVKAAKEYEVALEINNSSLTGSRQGSLEVCPQIARLAGKMEILVSLGSDSHWAGDVGELEAALSLVLEAGIKPENILNTSVAKVEEFIARRQQVRPKGKRSTEKPALV